MRFIFYGHYINIDGDLKQVDDAIPDFYDFRF